MQSFKNIIRKRFSTGSEPVSKDILFAILGYDASDPFFSDDSCNNSMLYTNDESLTARDRAKVLQRATARDVLKDMAMKVLNKGTMSEDDKDIIRAFIDVNEELIQTETNFISYQAEWDVQSKPINRKTQPKHPQHVSDSLTEDSSDPFV